MTIPNLPRPPSGRPWTLAAGWVFPIDGPPLRDGVVTILGERIESVGPRNGATPDLDLPGYALLPGLVNAHTHLDLSGLRGAVPPTPDFVAWLAAVVAHRRTAHQDDIDNAITVGLAESLAAGTTLVGDISAGGRSWRALRSAPLRAVVFAEVLGVTRERWEPQWAAARAWLAGVSATGECRPGLSPHAPYSVRADGFDACAAAGVPLAVHLAESRAEAQLLADQSGPFAAFLRRVGAWEPMSLARGAADVLERLSPAPQLLLAHGNYLANEIPPTHAAVVYCPRTHAAFGHEPYPLAEYLAKGARVALGTDSLASSPSLDVLGELRAARLAHPHVAGADLLRAATLSGAEALGFAGVTGTLTAGKSADMVVVPVANGADDPHELVLQGIAPVVATLYRGGWRGTGAWHS